MMDFTPRTSPVEWGTQPYIWTGSTIYQCVWFVYFRCEECSLPDPCYQNRATRTEGYNNAKTWLDNFKEPWEVKDTSYTPVKGDVAVFDGEYGHVVFFETDTMISEYSAGDPNSFRNRDWASMGKGNLLGFLHLPYDPVEPVARDTTVDQIQTTDEALRIRTKPSLDGEVVGHVQIGYYNVLDQKKSDGYTWYKLAKDRWCADVSTEFLPGSEDETIKQIEEHLKAVDDLVRTLGTEENDYKERLEKIHELSEV